MTMAAPSLAAAPNFVDANCRSPEWLLEVLELHRDQILSSVRAVLQEKVDKIVADLKEDKLAVQDQVLAEYDFAADGGHESRDSTYSVSGIVPKLKTMLSQIADDAGEDEEDRRRRMSTITNNDDEDIGKKISFNLAGHEDKKLKYCDYIAGFAIVANTVSLLVQLQWYGHVAAIELGISEDDSSWPMAGELFDIFEHVFNTIFLVELVVRLYLLRRSYFYEAFNWMDFILVFMTTVQMYILTPLQGSSSMSNLTLFRLLRFLRTVRVFKAVRVMRMFSELRILVYTFIASIRALLWSLVFLGFIIVLGALFLSFALHDTIIDPSVSREHRMWLYRYYGSSYRSVYTLFEVTMAGCWPTYFRPLMEITSGWYVIFILVYVSVVVFALTRIISALFLKETLLIASNDQESQRHEQEKKKRVYVSRLRDVYNAADTSGNGTINQAEFSAMVRNPHVNVILKMMDIDMHDAEELFHVLDIEGTGEITFEDFVGGVTRMKGAARAVDLIRVMTAHDKMIEHISSTSEEMKLGLDKLHVEEKRILKLLRRSLPEVCHRESLDKMLL